LQEFPGKHLTVCGKIYKSDTSVKASKHWNIYRYAKSDFLTYASRNKW